MVIAHVRRVIVLPERICVWWIFTPKTRLEGRQFVRLSSDSGVFRKRADALLWTAGPSAETCQKCLESQWCEAVSDHAGELFDRYGIATVVANMSVDPETADSVFQWIAPPRVLQEHGIPGSIEAQRHLLELMGHGIGRAGSSDPTWDSLRENATYALSKLRARVFSGKKKRMAAEKPQTSKRTSLLASWRTTTAFGEEQSPSADEWGSMIRRATAVYESTYKPMYTSMCVLGVHSVDDHTVVRSAYLKLLFMHHPDHGGNTDEMAKVNAAYQLITQSIVVEE